MTDVWKGRCHCGAIGFDYHCDIAPKDWSVRACQCRFCRCHDALSTSAKTSSINFYAQTPENLRRYRFGLKTADFLLCRNCGVYIGAVIELESGRYGIVNTHALEQQPGDLAVAQAAVYDGEDRGDRVTRRELRWSRVGEVPW